MHRSTTAIHTWNFCPRPCKGTNGSRRPTQLILSFSSSGITPSWLAIGRSPSFESAQGQRLPHRTVVKIKEYFLWRSPSSPPLIRDGGVKAINYRRRSHGRHSYAALHDRRLWLSDVSEWFKQNWRGRCFYVVLVGSASQQTRHIYPKFVQCWATVYDAGPPSTTLGHRLRRWPNIGQTLDKCVVFAGLLARFTLLGMTWMVRLLHYIAVQRLGSHAILQI